MHSPPAPAKTGCRRQNLNTVHGKLSSGYLLASGEFIAKKYFFPITNSEIIKFQETPVPKTVRF